MDSGFSTGKSSLVFLVEAKFTVYSSVDSLLHLKSLHKER